MTPRVTKKSGNPQQKHSHKAKQNEKRSKESNVSGFQKRMAQKPPKASEGLDVYEYDDKQRKGRSRAAVTMDLSKEEAREFAMGEEEELDDLERMRQKLHMGDDLEIDSENDEDIDSDDAFASSDEERFADYNLKSSKPKTKTKAPTKSSVRFEVDLNEESDDSSEEEEDEEHSHMKGDDQEQDDEDMDEEDEDAENLQLSDEEEPHEALEALETYINKLESKPSSSKRKASEIDHEALEPPRQKRRILKERTEAGTEGEFTSATKQGSKLQLDDLLSPLVNEGTSISAHSLQSAARALKASKAAPLAAPLPLRTQDRLDRQAAYEQTKAEVQKWEPTMRRIREADHLSFPLQSKPIPEVNVASLASDFKPATKLESAVDKLLKAAELRDQDIAKTEELQMQHLTVEEIAERRAELRKSRDLMFRAEIKAKRVAKIKSKTYRKIQKKDRAKQADKLKEMGLGVDEEEERMKAETERAKERATLKHKNTGKWAMGMKHRGELDDDQRQQMQEMYDRGERLKQKIAGVESDEDEGNSSDDDGDIDGISGALRELDALGEDEPLTGSKSGLMEMQFMKRAQHREDAQNQGLVDSFKEELQKLGMNEADEDAVPTDQSTSMLRVGGRVYYQGGSKQDNTRTTNVLAAEAARDSSPEAAPTENPWLSVEPTNGKRSKAKNEVLLGKNSNAATLSKNAMKKRLRKQAEAVAQSKDDSNLEIDVNAILTLPKGDTASKARKPKDTDSGTHQVDKAYRDDDVDDEEVQMPNRQKGRPTAFEQRELVARAFAGDNVIEEFAEEKRREMDADAPKEVDTTLPGWGSWGGAGITKPPPKPERIKRFPGVDPKKRQDFGKDHVIISEKKDKKAEKYLVKDLPFPYTSKAQFERRLDVPLGMEWNTRATFQKATLPRVVKKMGSVIEPLERLF